MMSEKQYFQLAEKAKRRYEETLASLGETWTLIHGSTPPRIGVTRPKPRLVEDHQPQLGKALLEVVKEMPDEFTTVDVFKVMQANHPESEINRSAVSHTMKRLAEQVEPHFTIIEVGKGKRATKYKKTAVGSLEELF